MAFDIILGMRHDSFAGFCPKAFLLLFGFACALPLGAEDAFPRAQFVIDPSSRRGTLEPSKGHKYYAGYSLEANGSEIVCSVGTAPGAGACWPLVLNQKAAAPVELEAECRFEEGIGGQTQGSGQVYLYADLCFADGSRQDGYHVDYEKDAKLGWQRKKLVLDVGRPIRSASVYVFARYARGLKARFRAPSWIEYTPVGAGAFALDGVSVLNAKRLTERRFLVRDVAKDDGYAEIAGAGGTAKGIAVRVKSETVGAVTHYDIVAENTAGGDRAITLVFADPLANGPMTWFQDGLRSATVKPGDCERSNFRTSNGVGAGGLSPWPFAAVAVNGEGRAMAIDCGRPAYNRLLLNPALGALAMAVDLGFAPEKQTAHFRLSTFPFEAMYGFRGALTAYREAYPDFFKVRVPQQGVWMAFRPTSKVQGVEDFGFAYKEGEGEVPWDDAHGLLTFHYTEPVTWWMEFPPVPGKKLALEDAKAEAERLAAKGDMHALAWKTSVMKNERGEPYGSFRDTTWCNGVLWPMCSLPNLPGDVTDFKWKLGKEAVDKRFAAAYPNGVDGEYLDSAEMEPASLDFDRGHFAAADAPLVFSSLTKKPAIYTGLVWSEYTRDIARRVHDKGRFMMANCTPDRYAWISSYMDVLGTESIWINRNTGAWTPPNFQWFQYRRFLAGAKPWCFLLQEDFDRFDHACVEKSMHRMLAYAFFPGYSQPPDKGVVKNPETYYWLNPKYYNRDRELFKKFVPLIRKASEAGWRPVNRLLHVPNSTPSTEQFGDNLATLFNFSSKTQTWDVVSLSNLSNATDLVSGRKIVFEKGKAKVTLPPETTMLLAFDPDEAKKAMAVPPARLDLAPIAVRELATGKSVIEASLSAFDAFVAFRAAHPNAQIVLDSSTVPSTPDGSSLEWNVVRAIRRLVDGKTVFWKTITDRYSYLYWTPDQSAEDKVAPAAAYPDGRFALMERGKYYWANRVREQAEWVKALRGQTVDVVFLGDSQTHFLEGRYGRHESPWPSVTAFMKDLKTLNLGIGGDRVEHALWRAKNGQLDGYRTKFVSILIGSNTGGKRDPAEVLVRAISDLVKIVREKQPDATIVLTALFPNRFVTDDPEEIKRSAVRAGVRKLADGKKVLWLDVGDKLRGPDGRIRRELSCDGVHLNDAGYKIWLGAMREMMKGR